MWGFLHPLPPPRWCPVCFAKCRRATCSRRSWAYVAGATDSQSPPWQRTSSSHSQSWPSDWKGAAQAAVLLSFRLVSLSNPCAVALLWMHACMHMYYFCIYPSTFFKLPSRTGLCEPGSYPRIHRARRSGKTLIRVSIIYLYVVFVLHFFHSGVKLHLYAASSPVTWR